LSFQNAFDGMDTEDDEKVRFVIGMVILAVNPLSPSAIATLVELGKQEVMALLQLIQSLSRVLGAAYCWLTRGIVLGLWRAKGGESGMIGGEGG